MGVKAITVNGKRHDLQILDPGKYPGMDLDVEIVLS